MRILVAILVIVALILWAGIVWFALPLIGFGDIRPFDGIWVRINMIWSVWFTVGMAYLIRWLIRRKRAKALEVAVVEPEVVGDGEVLSEKLQEALDVLKKTSGTRNYLYDLPWYVIIGPPGAGKTTALLNSGIKFPLAEGGKGPVAGAGGTRYLDWWFAEEAVLIDTAGRYTTQDSDAEADKESWLAFLKQLKSTRTTQPINGVLLAISLQDVMTGSPGELERHADTIRSRLRELHDHLKVDVPVYVLLTKADLIAGFMEYFGAFNASRRQKVWGHTFQTENRKKQTVRDFGVEYDRLVERLSEEVTDRLQEEPDGINRIAIFGFPGQVAMLKDRLETLMTGIFGHTRYKVTATLRGFYFTSGTQEGTPLDQVLGAMQRDPAQAAIAGMSGKGRAYFLHDLLRKVIFNEAGWVSTDRKALRRQRAMRYSGFAAVGVATVTMLALWGWSFWQNRQLIRTAEAAIADYELAANAELTRAELRSIDLLEVLPYLDQLREMPLGYADEGESGGITEQFGLSQRDRLRASAEAAYAQALERMFRSRLILRVEQQVERDVRAGEVLQLYQSLKTYKLLGGLAPAPEDGFLIQFFREDWANVMYPGPANTDNRVAMERHLVAMLDLDNGKPASFELNGSLVDNAERVLARMNVADQAYQLILGTVEFAGIEPFSVPLRAGRDSDLVFETYNGDPLSEQVIPALFTYAGFHDFFLPQLSNISEALRAEQWLLGQYAEEADLDQQVRLAGPILVQRYTEDWIAAWDKVIENIKLRPMAADKPAYQALAAAAGARTSPIILLAEEIAAETRLTQEFASQGEGGSPVPLPGQDTLQFLQDEADQELTQGQRTLRDFLQTFDSGKGQGRAGPAGGSRRLPGAEIEAYFDDWHVFVEGDPGARRADQLLQTMSDIQSLLLIGADFPDRIAGQLERPVAALKQAQSRLPTEVSQWVGDAIRDFEGEGTTASIAELNEKLNSQVTVACQGIVANRFPFDTGSARDASMTDFTRLFAPNGIIDRFFIQELSPHVQIGAGGSFGYQGPLADRLSKATLREFERAAKIRDVFFAEGTGTPQIRMTVAPVALHETVETAVLQVDGQLYTVQQRGNQPFNFVWPGTSGIGSTTLQLTPSLRGRDSQITFNGPWAFARFVRGGNPRVIGPNMQTRHVIGGRHVGYRFDVAARENPFFLSALTEFSCPSGF